MKKSKFFISAISSNSKDIADMIHSFVRVKKMKREDIFCSVINSTNGFISVEENYLTAVLHFGLKPSGEEIKIIPEETEKAERLIAFLAIKEDFDKYMVYFNDMCEKKIDINLPYANHKETINHIKKIFF